MLITETKKENTGTKQKPGENIILAHGEATGHHHAVECDNADWWKGDGEQSIEVIAPARVIHQEHAPIPLSPARYVIRRQSEYSPAEIRRVAD